jgi:hypothetical protein
VALGTLDGSVVALLDADGWTEVENDDYGDSYASRIVWAAPESGDYFIEVGAAWGSETGTGDIWYAERTGDYFIEVGAAWGSNTGVGDYTLTLALSDIQDDHANGTNGATAIQVGQSAAGKLDYRDDVDLFSFTAQAGQLYQIDVALGTLDGSVVALLDADGWTEVENDDYGDSYASRIIWYAERTGDYFIEVGAAWGSNTGVGDYTLTLALSSGRPRSQGTTS